MDTATAQVVTYTERPGLSIIVGHQSPVHQVTGVARLTPDEAKWQDATLVRRPEGPGIMGLVWLLAEARDVQLFRITIAREPDRYVLLLTSNAGDGSHQRSKTHSAISSYQTVARAHTVARNLSWNKVDELGAIVGHRYLLPTIRLINHLLEAHDGNSQAAEETTQVLRDLPPDQLHTVLPASLTSFAGLVAKQRAAIFRGVVFGLRRLRQVRPVV